VKGRGKLVSGGSVAVELLEGGSQTLETKNVLLATGSEPAPLPPCPVDNAAAKIVDSTGALSLPRVPKSMVVVGGGVIGLELGSVWRRLGAEVTVVEFLDSLIPSMDKELATAFQRSLSKQGMKFMFGTKVTGSDASGEGVRLTLEPAKGGEAKSLDAEVVLVATGRRP